jgi:hypothetical protein
MSDLRLAVMGGKLLLRDDVLSVGPGDVRIAAGLVEGVDDQYSVNLNGALLFSLVEHQPSAETSNRRRVAPRQHRVGPHCDDLVGLAGLVVERPDRPFGRRRQPSEQQQAAEGFAGVRKSKPASFHRYFQHDTSLRNVNNA